MNTIFFTISCVEQLTFSKTFVNQLQFEQLILFLSKSETARNTHTADDFRFLTSFNFLSFLSTARIQLIFGNQLDSSSFTFSQKNINCSNCKWFDKGFGKCQLLDTIYSKENGVHVRQ